MLESNTKLPYVMDKVGRLLDVLDHEYRLLGRGAIKELEVLQSQKRELVESLSADSELLECNARFRQSESWTEFQELVENCRDRNLVNGATMQEMLRLRRAALEVILGRTSEDGQYHQDGRTRGHAQQRSLGQA